MSPEWQCARCGGDLAERVIREVAWMQCRGCGVDVAVKLPAGFVDEVG